MGLIIAIGIIVFLWLIFRGSKRAYLQSIVNKLAPQSHIRVDLYKSDKINAMATYDKNGNPVIYVSSAAVEILDKDELYFVLAHETAHHLKNHLLITGITEAIKRGSLEMIRPKPAWWEKLFFGKTDTPLWWKILSGGVTVMINKLIYMRQEKEADITAIELLKNAGLPISGAYKLFMRLEQQQDIFSKIYTYLFDEHPLSSKRWENLLQHYPELAKFERY